NQLGLRRRNHENRSSGIAPQKPQPRMASRPTITDAASVSKPKPRSRANHKRAVNRAVTRRPLGWNCMWQAYLGVRRRNLVMTSERRFRLAVVAVGLIFVSIRGGAQNAAPGGQRTTPPSSQVPTGRQGRGGYPLPALPAAFETYQHKIRVSV